MHPHDPRQADLNHRNHEADDRPIRLVYQREAKAALAAPKKGGIALLRCHLQISNPAVSGFEAV